HVGLGIVEVLEISGGRSPLIIRGLDAYPQHPCPIGVPTLNSEEPDIAVAVSNAGALGMITARTHESGKHLLAEIERAKVLTVRPLAVSTSVSRNAEHEYDKWVDAVIEGGIRIVETAGNSPRPLLPRLKEHGVTVIHKCTTVR